VSLQNDQTGIVAASATVTGLTGEWKQFTWTLKTGDVRFRRTTIHPHHRAPATVWFDLVSLFPPTITRARRQSHRHHEPAAAMQPKFMRLPGGNYVEGDHISERFDWKETIGPQNNPWTDRPRT